MPTVLPPARADISDTPSPSNAVAKAGLGALWDYVTNLLGTPGTQAGALTALGAVAKAGDNLTGALNEARATVVGNATTSDIWGAAGNKINLTGVITYTNFPAAPQAGANRWLYPTTGSVFTNSATLDILGSVNFTVAAGDIVYLEAITTTTFKLIPIRKNGRAVAAGIDFDGVGSETLTRTWTRAATAGKINYINNAGATTQTFPLASTFSSGQALAFYNFGAGQATFTRQGSDGLIWPGSGTSFILNQNDAFIAFTDGTSWFITFLNGATGLAPQAWSNLTASRAIGTTYTNSTGRPIKVFLSSNNSNVAFAYWNAVVAGVTIGFGAQAPAVGATMSLYFEVPKGATYSVAHGNGATNPTTWFEQA